MTFQPAPNTVQAAIRFLQNDVAIENTLDFEFPGSYTGADLDDLAAAIDNWTVTYYMPTCGPETVYQLTYVRGLTSAVDYQAANSTGAGTAGTRPFSEPNNVTKAFTLRSGMTGRNARGRLFHAGVPNDALTDTNHLSQDWIDDVIDALQLLKTAVEALTWAWVIVSRYVDGVKRVTAVNYNVTDIDVTNLTTDSARGRLPKA